MPAVETPVGQTTPQEDLEPRRYARAVRRLMVFLVAIGIAIRVARAFIPSAIWGDEAMLALNIMARDYRGLMGHLDFGQVAPLLFLWAERLALDAFGASGWSLRLFPLLASMGGLVLFWDLARRTIPPTAAVIAVGLMAVSTWPVSMAWTLKPYAGDLFWSVLLLNLAARWHRRPERLWPLAALALSTPAALAASYPTVFVAGAVCVYLLPVAWRAGSRAKWLFIAYSAAMVTTFAWTYLAIGAAQAASNAGSLTTGEFMRTYWKNGFPPDTWWRVPLWLLEANTGRAFAYPVGDSNGGSTATTLLMLGGIVWCWRNGYRPLVVVCLVPFVLNLAAAVMGKYPYAACCRLSQHLAPAICLMAGAGWAAALEWWRPRRVDRLYLLRLTAGLLAALAIVSLLLKARAPDRDAISRFSRDLQRELSLVAGPDDRIVVMADPGTDVTTLWYLHSIGDRVTWAKPGDPLPDAERVWVVTTHAGAATRQTHTRLVKSPPDWRAGDSTWYSCRPDDHRHGKGIWRHVGITLLQRTSGAVSIPPLQATP